MPSECWTMTMETFDSEYFEGEKSRYGRGGGYARERFDVFLRMLTGEILRAFQVDRVKEISSIGFNQYSLNRTKAFSERTRGAGKRILGILLAGSYRILLQKR